MTDVVHHELVAVAPAVQIRHRVDISFEGKLLDVVPGGTFCGVAKSVFYRQEIRGTQKKIFPVDSCLSLWQCRNIKSIGLND